MAERPEALWTVALVGTVSRSSLTMDLAGLGVTNALHWPSGLADSERPGISARS